jgi:hypothetical protein
MDLGLAATGAMTALLVVVGAGGAVVAAVAGLLWFASRVP